MNRRSINSLVGKIFLMVSCLLGLGCSTTKMLQYRIESEPSGAQVDLNGQSIGNTPTEVALECKRHWVGYAFSDDGYGQYPTYYTFTAYPNGAGQQSQSKTIDACQGLPSGGGSVRFDLSLISVTPRQSVDLNINQNDSRSNSSIEETINSLKKLRDQGVLSEKEYKYKVDKLIRDKTR